MKLVAPAHEHTTKMHTQTWQRAQLLVRFLRTMLLGLFAMFACTLLATVLSSIAPQHTSAATSNTINFQARLENDGGAISADGYYNIEFKLYSASSGGSAEWTEDYTYNSGTGSCSGPLGGNDCRVRVANGYLTANLGSATAFPGTINWNQQQWLTMNIGGTVTTGSFPTMGDGEMSPRLLLTAVPYAFQAGQLGTTSGANVATLSFTTPTGTDAILLPDASGTVCLQSAAACGFALSTGSSAAFVQGGNSFGAQGVLGTNDTNSLAFRTNNANRLVLDTSGNLTLQQASTLSIASATTGTALTIQGGSATSGTNVGGNLMLQGGAGASTGASGSVIVKSNTNNSTSAFQVQNSSGANLFTADTTNGNIVLGNDGTPTALTVRGGAATGSNISGTNLTVDASNGTGAGGSGDLILRTAAGSAVWSPVTSQKIAGTQNSSSATFTLTLPAGASLNDRLILVTQLNASGVAAGSAAMSVSDNAGNTWTKHTEAPHWQPGSFDSTSEVWSAPQTTAGATTITLIYTGPASSNIQWDAAVQEYNGLSTATGSSAVDVSVVAKGTSNTGNSGSTAATAAANELVIGGYSDDGGSDTLSAGSSYTMRIKKDATSVSQAAIEDKNSGTSGTTQSAIVTASSSADWGMAAVVFKNAPVSSTDTLADRLHITAAGNVGINNTAPASTLDVSGSARVASVINSTTAFQVQNASSSNVLTVNTTNMVVTVSALIVSGSITVNGHVITGGSAPSVAAGSAACTSPTVSVTGNDTTGIVAITTGTGCSSSGQLASVTFNSAYASAPQVQLAPVTSAAALLPIYRTTSTTGFTISTPNTPTSTTTYTFSYFTAQ